MAQQDDSKRAVDYRTLSDSAIFEILDSLDESQIKMVLDFLVGYTPEGMAGALENLDERMQEAHKITLVSAKQARYSAAILNFKRRMVNAKVSGASPK